MGQVVDLLWGGLACRDLVHRGASTTWKHGARLDAPFVEKGTARSRHPDAL